jgi:Protein of unknown function (DUF3465)
VKQILLLLLLPAGVYFGYQQEQVQGTDSVSFYGQFETNDRGGVIHWTHRDPRGRHIDGWLEHRGRRYQ